MRVVELDEVAHAIAILNTPSPVDAAAAYGYGMGNFKNGLSSVADTGSDSVPVDHGYR